MILNLFNICNIPDYTMYEIVENLGDYLDDSFIGDKLVQGKRVTIALKYHDRVMSFEVNSYKAKEN